MAGLHSTELAPQLYALRTSFPEMFPRFTLGEIAIFDKEEPAQPGDDVVVTFNDGSWVVRHLVASNEATVTLETYTPAMSCTVHLAEISSLVPVVDRRPARDWEWLTQQLSNDLADYSEAIEEKADAAQRSGKPH